MWMMPKVNDTDTTTVIIIIHKGRLFITESSGEQDLKRA